MQQKWQPVSYFYLLKRAENFRAIFIWSRKWHTQNYTYCPCHLDENILLKYWLYNIFEKGQQQNTFIYLCKICKIHRLSLLTLGTISASFASCLEDHLLKSGLNGLKKYLFAHQFQPCCPFELSDSQHSDKLVLWLWLSAFWQVSSMTSSFRSAIIYGFYFMSNIHVCLTKYVEKHIPVYVQNKLKDKGKQVHNISTYEM